MVLYKICHRNLEGTSLYSPRLFTVHAKRINRTFLRIQKGIKQRTRQPEEYGLIRLIENNLCLMYLDRSFQRHDNFYKTSTYNLHKHQHIRSEKVTKRGLTSVFVLLRNYKEKNCVCRWKEVRICSFKNDIDPNQILSIIKSYWSLDIAMLRGIYDISVEIKQPKFLVIGGLVR